MQVSVPGLPSGPAPRPRRRTSHAAPIAIVYRAGPAQYRGGMALFTRRTVLPPDVRSALHLRHRDTVLASAEITDGWAVATRLALYVALTGGDAARPDVQQPDVQRRPWSDVDRASLDPETDTITVGWIDGTTQDLHLLNNRQPAFARALRERVQSSVVHAETVRVVDGTQVRVALRRDEDGRLFSQVIGEGRVNLADPVVAAVVNAAEARVRSAAGLPL